MANEKWLVSKSILEAAADTIRSKLSVSSSFAPKDFASKIREIPAGDYMLSTYINGSLTTFIDTDGLITYIPDSTFATNQTLKLLSFPACSIVGSYAFRSCFAEFIDIGNCQQLGESAFQDCYSLTEVNISNLTSIPANAFSSCVQLQRVTLGSNCSAIGLNAFSWCYKLSSINLDNCIYLSAAFGYCSSLSTISLPKLVYYFGGFNNCPNLESIYLGSDNLVFSCTGPASCKISSIDLPNCNYITGFSNCSLLATGLFPTATCINSNAFKSCPEITEAFIPACYCLGASAFADCTKLSKVIMLNTTSSWHFWNTSLAPTAFANTPITNSTYLGYYGSIYVPSILLSIYQAAWGDRVTTIDSSYDSKCVYGGEFYSKTITSVPNTKVTAEMIMNHAFDTCTNLLEVSFPNCSFIGEYAFYKCWNLSVASFPAVKNILNYAFGNCSNLIAVNLQNCIYLSQYAFAYCSKLANINLSNCVMINANAFYGCSALSQASLPQCRIIGTEAFAQTGISNIYLPKVSSLAYSVFMNTKISQLTDNELPICTYINGSTFKSCSLLTKVNLTNPIFVSSNAFENCQTLSEVRLPNCMGIGGGAFRSCYRLVTLDLTNISLVPSINAYTFDSTPISGYSQYTSSVPHIYVPQSLYNKFITANYWSDYADKIVSIA